MFFSFSTEGDDIVVSGVYAECGDAAAREAAYRLYLAPDARQDGLLTAALDARHELASVCGFQCYADRSGWVIGLVKSDRYAYTEWRST